MPLKLTEEQKLTDVRSNNRFAEAHDITRLFK
jgi:hypothetical protein